MKLLFLGGSRFVGKHLVLEAAERGHEVTLFNRGNHPVPTAQASQIQGDRDSDLDRLPEEEFDAVIDTSGYVPRQVQGAARALASRVKSYLFISSISVYASHEVPFQGEDAPLIELEDPTAEEVTGETYGGLKVLCERALEEFFPGQLLVVRPGVIVGPDDPTDRFTYWPVRVGRGGEVLAPNGPYLPVQWIDARDLAAWLISALERGTSGTFNAVSEPDRFTLGRLLDVAKAVTGSDARFSWLDEEFLLEHEVKPFVELPLWIPGLASNFSRIDASRAKESGLTIRDVADTVTDTLEWYRSQGDRELKAGLEPERERRLLARWRAHNG